jgi:WD40 repeat protein
MNGQAIPGFYYDEAKKKYFRIQSQTAARDLDLKYSTSNLRKQDRKDRFNKAAHARASKTRKERVVRRHASVFSHFNLDREIGFRPRALYTHTLWPDACMSGVDQTPHIISALDDSPVRFFDRDPVSKTLYAVHGENRVKRRRMHPMDRKGLHFGCDMEHPRDLPPTYSFEPWDEISRTTSTVSSLSYLPATGSLAVTTYGSDRPPVVQISDPERDGPYVTQVFTPKACSTIWGAAARPVSFSPSPALNNTVAANYTEHLAVAASSSMLLFTRADSGAWDSKTVVDQLPADILSLDWISYTTVVLGCRDGKIHLYDTRSGGSSHILTHPYPVSKIKPADDPTRLICSGLQDTLFLYDIRSPRPSRSNNTPDHHYNEQYFKTLYPGNRDHKKRRKLNHSAFRKWSQPVLSFPHTNLDDLELDMAVHPRLGLIAAAQDDATSEIAIRVSNMWTGKTVREFSKHSSSKQIKQQKSDKLRALRFVDDEAGGLSLWAPWRGGIVSFAW